MDNPAAPRLIRLADVMDRTALSRTVIYRRMKDGTFPKPAALGPRCLRWIDTDITAWIERQRDVAEASSQAA